MFCQFCVYEIFCKKSKEFKTALMTSFILLLVCWRVCVQSYASNREDRSYKKRKKEESEIVKLLKNCLKEKM